MEEELEEKMEQRSEVQQRYQEVSRDKKVLEKLKSKREADYYSQAKLEEFKAFSREYDPNSGLCFSGWIVE